MQPRNHKLHPGLTGDIYYEKTSFPVHLLDILFANGCGAEKCEVKTQNKKINGNQI